MTKKEFGVVIIDAHQKLTDKQQAEAERYQAACEEITSDLLKVAQRNNVCPWCLLMHVGIAAKGAMQEGDIEHINAIVEH